MITSRQIEITSDCGHYTIKAKLIALADCYSQDNWSCQKSYKGSVWTASIFKDGQRVNGIQVNEPNYQPYVSFSEWGGGLCQYGVKLSKNTILYAAVATRMFSKALEGIDTEKVEKQYYKDYVKARIAYEMR